MAISEKKEYINITNEYLKKNKEIRGKILKKFGSINYYIHENVFSPEIFEDTFFFAQSLPVLKNSKVLEIGAGTGLISLYLAHNGASHITSTDINPYSIDNITENVELNNLKDKICVLKSDVFDELKSSLKYDVIFWNVPFIYKKTENNSYLESSVFDHNYYSLSKYIYNYQRFISKNGRVFIGFSKVSGHLSELVRMANKISKNVIEIDSYTYSDGFSVELYELVEKKEGVK